MNLHKHTPGPWRYSKGHIGASIRMFVQCNPKIHDGMHIHNGEINGQFTEESEANARLIAAAPEMLEALEWFCGRVERGEVRSKKTYAKFKALIQKAVGE